MGILKLYVKSYATKLVLQHFRHTPKDLLYPFTVNSCFHFQLHSSNHILLWIYLVRMLCTNCILWYAAFCIWLFPFNIIFIRFIHVLTCFQVCSFWLHLPVDRYLDYFHIGPIINTLNIEFLYFSFLALSLLDIEVILTSWRKFWKAHLKKIFWKSL